MKTEDLLYTHDKTSCKGWVAYDDKKASRRPAVLVAHAWAGRDAFACAKAEALAKLGYVGFAIDMYGDARLGKDKDENAQLMTPFLTDRMMLKSRIQAAVDAIKKHPTVNADKIAAIGFCFGGLCVLDLARSGSAVKGVVSFHGLLGAPENLPNADITARVLALHGYDDPMAPPEQLVAFAKEMTESKADWEVLAYGNTMHAFTNPEANDPGFGTVYREAADKRSWKAMKTFLGEVLA
ncbi:MAG: carboxymethylenebutenolidase [Elusimicrobia bacterium CG1_02_63_36]|nr:MAG: carboxymethylenebutenolidase [Elusimicrobia bacterium CG1_02_63_36]PIP82779.1 MAG: carboxymethylenebutenolidase [Elusimicrobia bacterium CG22_combo_CG10-13_8_21_14_all_63_91]PJA16086.1 MAG: carboxymethylenebutenolidase [Elusimicrobia bacterium CG_4_10_14_0_2_um_filter_63_34]PJB24673.1 MAG: carboxymethylenebutenolidase [Elusimicrobia bacterium CG_4_9_14_3_um_filter_62_55]